MISVCRQLFLGNLGSSIRSFISPLSSCFPHDHMITMLYLLSGKEKLVTLSVAHYLTAALKIHPKIQLIHANLLICIQVIFFTGTRLWLTLLSFQALMRQG